MGEPNDRLNIKETTIGSIPFFVSMIFLGLFALLSMRAVEQIVDPYIKSALLLGWMFCVIKLIGWIKYPVIFLK